MATVRTLPSTLLLGDAFEAKASSVFSTHTGLKNYSEWVGDTWKYDFDNEDFEADQTLTFLWKVTTATLPNGKTTTSKYWTIGGIKIDTKATSISATANFLHAYLYLERTVTYTDGLNGDVFEDQVYTVRANESTPAFDGTPTRVGYTFADWDPQVEETVSGDVTYTTWTADEYTVSFDSNGGNDLSDKSITVTYGEAYGELPDADAVDGFTSDGWYLGEDEITADTIVTTTGNHELFQKRSIEAPVVKIAPSSVSHSYNGESVTLTASTTEYSGLVYSYQWYKDDEIIEGATDKELVLNGDVADSGTYKVVVTVTKAETCEVTSTNESAEGEASASVAISKKANTIYYKANGGTGGPINNFSNLNYATVQTKQPTREGYTFAGWNTEPDGSGDSYKGGDIYYFTGDTGNGGQKAYLYAQWTVKEYELPVDPANGEDPYTVTITYEDVLGDMVEEPVREGYTFTGWVDQNGDPVDLTATYTEAIEQLTATWEANEYVVPVDPANGEEPYTLILTYEDAVGLYLTVHYREGYTFTGWVDQDGNPVDLNATYTVAIQKLVGTWKLKEYDVPVDPANGEDPYTVTITYEDVLGDKVEEPVREGYTFAGWVDQNGNPVDLTATYTVAIEQLTATWEANEYVVPVDPANGEDAVDVTYTYEDVIGDKYDFATEPTRKGYTFEGWVDQDGNPVDLTATYTEDLKSISASWKGKTCTVTFKLNEDEGTLSFTSKTVVNGDPLGTTPTVERAGYTFIGWYDANGKYYDSTTIFEAAQDITLTGRWTKSVPTGDGNNAALFALVMLGSLACAGVTVLRLRKGKEKI